MTAKRCAAVSKRSCARPANWRSATARGPFKRWTKGDDNSPVSEGDIAVNDLLRARLGALVPGAGWLSEETEALPDRSLPLAWIVDPIDGTRAYISGRADWTISVALVENGRPVLAALFAPAADEMFLACAAKAPRSTARRSRPAAARRSSAPSSPAPSAISTGSPGSTRACRRSPRCSRSRCGIARVAQGSLDAAFASPGSHDWDLAAADLLVHEAGGAITDIAGRPLCYDARRIAHGALIAAGQARHGALMDLLRDRRTEFA